MSRRATGRRSLHGYFVFHVAGWQNPICSGGLRRPIGRNPTLIHARVLPKLAGDLERVDAGGLPPGSFVAGAMNRAVMDPAERHGELIAGLAADQQLGRKRLAQVDCAAGIRPSC